MVTAIYARISTRDGRQNTENQLQVLRKKASELDLPISEYVDEASGSKSDRKELIRLMADVRKGTVKTIFIWALDRLTREGISAMCGYLETCKKNGTRVVSVQEVWLDTEGPVSELLVAIFAWVARQERIRISDRIKAGLNRVRSEGKKIGRPAQHKTSKVILMRRSGKKMREISVETGIPLSTVFDILRRTA